MRKFAAIALFALAMPSASFAQGAPAAAPAAGHYTTAATSLGTMMDDPAAKAVLNKHIPMIVSNERIAMARSMTLKEIQGFAGDMVSDDVLAKIDADLATLPAKK